MPNQVRLCAGMRIFQRKVYPGLCSQVDSSVELLVGKQCCHGGIVGKINFRKMEIRQLQQVQTRLLKANVIILIKSIDFDNVMTSSSRC